MKFRILTLLLTVPVLFMALSLWAQPAANTTQRDDPAAREQIIARQYREFRDRVLKLKSFLEKSDRPEDLNQAKILGMVLDKARDSAIDIKLDQTIKFLAKSSFSSLDDYQKAAADTKQLADNMKEILDLLRLDNRGKELKEQQDLIKKVIEEITKRAQEEKQLEVRTRMGKDGPKDLDDKQGDVKDKTGAIAKMIDKNAQKGKKSDGGEAKNATSQAKDGGKSDGKNGGESKGEDKPGESKKGQAKDGKDKEGKNAKPGEAKPGQDKNSDAKPGQAKPGDKGAEAKPGAAKDSKSGDPKAGAAKPSEAKSGGAESKKGDAKPSDKSAGKGSAKSGQGSDQPPADSQAKGGDSKNQPPPQNGPPDELSKTKKRIQDAQDAMKKAQDDLKEKKLDPAGDDMAKAAKILDIAKKELEKLLEQLREEELERMLAQLIQRCERMKAMQIDVLAGTEGVFKSIQFNSEKKPNDANRQESIKLSDKERDIVAEADRAIDLLEGEGSGVAFPEAFQEVREDMKHVKNRLDITDPGILTQGIEKDIIASLDEMIDALKKQQKKMDDRKNPPPGSGKPPPPPDQKLLDQIAELKMIRAMQMRINTRTKTYGRLYQGEQAADPTIQGELRNLSERENRIFEITRSISKGDNK